MDFQATKEELAKMILEIDDTSVLDKFLHFMRSESTLSEKQKRAIDLALEQVERGETKSHELVMEETRKRYPKYFR